jgi:hypothetical protein
MNKLFALAVVRQQIQNPVNKRLYALFPAIVLILNAIVARNR